MVDDQTARERIAEILDRTLMVEAGAGSGKTTSLVGRMIALIESGAPWPSRLQPLRSRGKQQMS